MYTGVITYAALQAEGHSRAEILKLVDAGRLHRVSRGWYAAPDANPDVVRAVQLGGTLDCLSAARFYGLWVPPPTKPLHICIHTTKTGAMTPAAIVHRSDTPIPPDGIRPLLETLQHVILHHDEETALMVLEPAVEKRAINVADAEALLSQAPKRRKKLRGFEPTAQSGTETRVRLFIRSRRVPVKAQVFIPGVGRVDLLVGECLIIECDSRAHHTGIDNYANDRQRDLTAAALGYERIRLTYEQVMFDWEATRAALDALLRRGVHHRRRPSPT